MAPTFPKLELQAPSHVGYIDPKQKGLLPMTMSLEETQSLIMSISGSWDVLPLSRLPEKQQQTEPISSQCPGTALLCGVLPVFCGSLYSGPFQIT